MMHCFLGNDVILAPLFRSMNEIFMIASITRCPNSHSIAVSCNDVVADQDSAAV